MRLIDAEKTIEMIETKINAIESVFDDDEENVFNTAKRVYVTALKTLINDIKVMPEIEHNDVAFHIGKGVWLKFTNIKKPGIGGETE